MDITIEQLAALNPGNVIETVGLFPGLSKEPLTWEYLGTLSGKSQFRVSYIEVFVGHMHAQIKDGELSWAMV